MLTTILHYSSIHLARQQLSLYGTNVLPISTSSTSKFQALNFQTRWDLINLDFTFGKFFTLYYDVFRDRNPQLQFPTSNLPTIIFSIVSKVIQFKFFKRIFETIARSRAYGGFNPSKSAEPYEAPHPTFRVLLSDNGRDCLSLSCRARLSEDTPVNELLSSVISINSK